ncbi:DUF421 domain-containing protein [Carboxydochorda subterranea]|uniref:DUF421 domain-containing protein n=1 Tax=Carboxydichorda subterranea TaxID=3109565 RepID=A0ABZ1BWM5_9FIRM|nr:DUF421 domain-containing protein [Limnochorda sp. L945t]WRP16513.1 DUF421 domain-containing protein [Limnochorda sp. L945t]
MPQHAWLHPLSLAAKTFFFYILLLVVVRVMGKREIGTLSPWDLVLTIMLAELAALPIENSNVSVVEGAVPIFTLLVTQLLMSWASLKSTTARNIIAGTPSIVVKDGRIVEQELRRLRYGVDDLMEQLRQKNLPNISDVEVAILETNGQLSVIPKSQKRPVRPSDLGISTSYEGLPIPLINDGRIDYRALAAAGLDITWLKKSLEQRGIHDPKEVLYASLDSEGQLFVQEREPPGG